MKTLIFAITAGAVALFTAHAYSADKLGVETIAVVDIQAIMKDASAAQDVRNQIDKKKNDFQTEITKKEEELRQEDKKLAEQRNVLSKEAFEKKADAFKNKVNDVQREVQSRRAQLETAYGEALAKLQENVLEIVAEIGKEKGFLVAVPTSQILYAKDGLNITQEVLEKLNKKLP
ncbi:MAG: OmpH family outer membrane protein, partial [Rectinemataceae bacterium]|nr:OmpH family outer membrane protein [Rectinemataceae bacterium]